MRCVVWLRDSGVLCCVVWLRDSGTLCCVVEG